MIYLLIAWRFSMSPAIRKSGKISRFAPVCSQTAVQIWICPNIWQPWMYMVCSKICFAIWYIYICVYLYKYLFIYIYICIWYMLYIYVYTHDMLYIYMVNDIYIYTHFYDIYIYICIYLWYMIYLYIYTYVYIYIYDIYSSLQKWWWTNRFWGCEANIWLFLPLFMPCALIDAAFFPQRSGRPGRNCLGHDHKKKPANLQFSLFFEYNGLLRYIILRYLKKLHTIV